jgi:hypothetical protein
VTLQPDLVTEVEWWTHPAFEEKAAREAAELVAARVLQPVLRSRGAVSAEAAELAGDEAFSKDMNELFTSAATGKYIPPTLVDAIRRIEDLERRLDLLEQRAPR